MQSKALSKLMKHNPRLLWSAILIPSIVIIGTLFAKHRSSRAPVQTEAYYGPSFLAALKKAAASDTGDEIGRILAKDRDIPLKWDALQSVGKVVSGPERTFALIDGVARQVHVFDANGQHVALLGTHGTAPGQYLTPSAVASLPDGYAVADFTKRRVNVYDVSGRFKTSFVYTPQRFSASSIAYIQSTDSFLLLGNQWMKNKKGEDTTRIAHRYSRDGRYLGSSLMLPSRFEAEGLNVMGTPLLASDGATSFRIMLPYYDGLFTLDSEGNVTEQPHLASRFLPPTPTTRVNRHGMESYNAWSLEWTPIVSVTVVDNYLLVEYQTFSPLRYTLDVWDMHLNTLKACIHTNHLITTVDAKNRIYLLDNLDGFSEKGTHYVLTTADLVKQNL